MKKILSGLLIVGSISSFANECNINEIDFLRISRNSLKEIVRDELRTKGYEVNHDEPGYKLEIGFHKRTPMEYRSQIGYLKGSRLQSIAQDLDQAARRAVHYIDERINWNYEFLALKEANDAIRLRYNKYLRRACIGNCGNWKQASLDLRSRKRVVKDLLNRIPECEKL